MIGPFGLLILHVKLLAAGGPERICTLYELIAETCVGNVNIPSELKVNDSFKLLPTTKVFPPKPVTWTFTGTGVVDTADAELNVRKSITEPWTGFL